MNRFFTWGAFIVIVGLVIWGLVAAEKKADREGASALLPDQIVSTDHIRGSEAAAVTLVEYGDFQCPACALYYPIVERLVSEYSSSTLRFVARHFALSQHANAMPAALAAEAADKQGKFWEMYGKLYDSQRDWENSKEAKNIFLGYARDLGLDEEKFLNDFDLPSSKEKINNDYKSGLKAGVNSTPSFFVNGKKINNPQSYEDFKRIIDEAVSKAGK
ncbi:MAG: thioredoxin domain-containing protein [bacterium]|nr:thioredoxin domain-containing protein [bacterium]